MRRLLITLLVSLLLLSCQEKSLTREELLLNLDSLEHKFTWLDYRINLEQYELFSTGRSDSLDFFINLYRSILANPDLSSMMERGKRLLKDDENQRRYVLIGERIQRGRIESRPNIIHLRDSLSKLISNYNFRFDGAVRKSSSLYKKYRSDDKRVERERAYRAWCGAGNEIADGLSRLFRLRNQEARKVGYNSYFALAFAYESISQGDYLKLIDRLDSLSASPYRKALDRVRNKLDMSAIDIWDIAYSSKKIRDRVDRRLPVDIQLKLIAITLKAIGFDLDKLPIYIEAKQEQGLSEGSHTFLIKPPYDIRIVASLSQGMQSTSGLMMEIGRALHASHIKQSREIFTTISPAWSEGMAQIFSSLCYDSLWLANYLSLPSSAVADYLKAVRDLQIADLRMNLLQLKFEYEAYANPNRDLNQLYWDLYEHYMMLPRHDDLSPWATVVQYMTNPVKLHNSLFADIITAQSRSAIIRQYTALVDNHDLGAVLIQNYFRFGSRYEWRDLLKRGTDEPFSPDYLISALELID